MLWAKTASNVALVRLSHWFAAADLINWCSISAATG
jgi:hypothetical protein